MTWLYNMSDTPDFLVCSEAWEGHAQTRFEVGSFEGLLCNRSHQRCQPKLLDSYCGSENDKIA